MSNPDSTSTDQTSPAGADPAGSRPAGPNWRDMRRAERAERRAQRHGDWGGLPIGGVIILLVGAVFLARNFGFNLPDNWWAIFILIPAAATLVTAARFYRADGSMSGRAWGSAIGGVLMLAVALALFLGVDWGAFWPVILIVVGAGIVFRGWRQR
jgi:hypothetical protein